MCGVREKGCVVMILVRADYRLKTASSDNDSARFPSLFKEGTFGNDAKHVSERGWLQRAVT